MRCIVGAASALLLASAAPAFAGPAVEIDQGRVEGFEQDGVEAFLGLPFAQPPVGRLRWRAPQKPGRWVGTLVANRPGPDCMQDKVHNPLGPDHDNRQSEDCLYLNIWRPAGARAAPLPVMVWIHGGAFIMGSGAMPAYAGDQLARDGVIVVSINYRLGRFGTFTVPALIDEQRGQPLANYGLLDQIAALEWVRTNIAAFGGDPGNVTVFGESAGASSVNFLMASPLAKGLFVRAISSSGGASADLVPLAEANRQGLAWAKAKGIAGAGMAALRALSAEAVLDAPVTAPAFPVIDGAVIAQSIPEAFAGGAPGTMPYLVGANDWEESLLRWLPGAAGALRDRLGPAFGPLLARYARSDEPAETSLARMWGEAVMVLPARRRALDMAAHGAPVWRYRYSYVPEALRGQLPGAGHEAEIEMVFGHPSRQSRAGWTAADAAMSRRIRGYWIAFAKTGNPNHAGAPHWPAVAPSDPKLMEFGPDQTAARSDFDRERLNALERALAATAMP